MPAKLGIGQVPNSTSMFGAINGHYMHNNNNVFKSL